MNAIQLLHFKVYCGCSLKIPCMYVVYMYNHICIYKCIYYIHVYYKFLLDMSWNVVKEN